MPDISGAEQCTSSRAGDAPSKQIRWWSSAATENRQKHTGGLSTFVYGGNCENLLLQIVRTLKHLDRWFETVLNKEIFV